MRFIWLIAAPVLVGIDRLTKWAVTSNMELFDTINIIKAGDTEILNIYYCLNDGAAFSELSGHRALLVVLTSAIILGVLAVMVSGRVKRPVYLAAGALVLGGGIGNLIDRIFNEGLVIDFIDFSIINFPIFNFADICAVCGAGLLLLTAAIDEIRELRSKKAAKAAEKGDNGDA